MCTMLYTFVYVNSIAHCYDKIRCWNRIEANFWYLCNNNGHLKRCIMSNNTYIFFLIDLWYIFYDLNKLLIPTPSSDSIFLSDPIPLFILNNDVTNQVIIYDDKNTFLYYEHYFLELQLSILIMMILFIYSIMGITLLEYRWLIQWCSTKSSLWWFSIL